MPPEIIVITDALPKQELVAMSEQRFGDMVKAVVDIQLGIMALGGELHADEEQVLLDRGSKQEDLWGINLYHAKPRDAWIEFDSMINIRPRQGNPSRGVVDVALQHTIAAIVNRLITD